MASLTWTSCAGDARVGEQTPRTRSDTAGVRQVALRPGVPAAGAGNVVNPYAGDPQGREHGKRLYNWMNCSGCHFEGGGGIGPPLMDEEWIYGGTPAQIFDSIVNGRANGMPAYGDKLPADQVWQIVAHVQSLSEAGEQAGER